MSEKPTIQTSASPVATPQVGMQTFDATRQQVLQLRAAKRRKRLSKPQFIFDRIAADIAERLLMINRRFENALLIAPDGFEPLLRSYLHQDKTPKTLIATALSQLGPTLKATSEFDLIILCLSHHNENNPAGLLNALKDQMVDDGHIMTVCLGGNSLSALRVSLYEADQTFFGGIAARIHPKMELQTNVQLLNHCGYKLTVGDRDRVNVSYKKLSTLIGDLRDMGETYALNSKRISNTTREFWQHVETNLKLENERINIEYDILWASGWTPHHSQQKPLKPGSAKHHLSEAFKPRDRS